MTCSTAATAAQRMTRPDQEEGAGWLWRLYLGVRCALLLMPWLARLLISDVVLSALLPVSNLFPDLCYDLASRIAEAVWLGIQIIFTHKNHAKILVSGVSKLPRGESAIVVANHVQWADFYMIQQLALESGMLGRCRWFAKRQLRWVPFLGWGLWAMRMPLVSRNWMVDQREVGRVFGGLLKRHWPMWLISYSEATRYTLVKRYEAEVWCKNNHKRLGHHVLYPRTKGFIASVQTLRGAPHVKAVYDVTIAYAKLTVDGGVVFQQPPSFIDTVRTPRLDEQWKFFVHVERFPICELPETDEALALWLENRWVQKGERLEGLRQRLAKGLPCTDLSLSN